MLSPVSTWMGDRLGTLGGVGFSLYSGRSRVQIPGKVCKKLLFGRVWGILNTFKHVRVCNMNLDDRLELTESVDPPSVRWKTSRKIWIVPRGPVAQDERLVPVW